MLQKKKMNVFPFDYILILSLTIRGEIVSKTIKPFVLVRWSDSGILIPPCNGGIHGGSKNITFAIGFAPIYFSTAAFHGGSNTNMTPRETQ